MVRKAKTPTAVCKESWNRFQSSTWRENLVPAESSTNGLTVQERSRALLTTDGEMSLNHMTSYLRHDVTGDEVMTSWKSRRDPSLSTTTMTTCKAKQICRDRRNQRN